MGSSYVYKPPLALTVLAGIFLLLGAIFLLIVAIDIIWRRGWKSMMWIMYKFFPTEFENWTLIIVGSQRTQSTQLIWGLWLYIFTSNMVGQ